MESPIKPSDSDCCNSGCNPCIFDIYEEQLKKYSQNLEKYKEELTSSYRNCICPNAYTVFKLTSKENHTPNSYLYKFEYCRTPLENDNKYTKKLTYGTGQHFLLKARELNSEKEFTRAYTPIQYGENDNKSFTILVRLYDEGKMSSYLGNLRIGDETLWRGPYGNFIIDYTLKNILFIAQGTGIAPIYSVIKTMLYNNSCETFLHLLYCCRNIDDIFLRNEFYRFKAHWNFNYEVFLTDFTNISCKYEEIIHEKKMEKNDIYRLINKVKGNSLQVIICGSKEFEEFIFNLVKENVMHDCNVFMFE